MLGTLRDAYENAPCLRGFTRAMKADPNVRKPCSNQLSGMWPSYAGCVLTARVCHRVCGEPAVLVRARVARDRAVRRGARSEAAASDIVV